MFLIRLQRELSQICLLRKKLKLQRILFEQIENGESKAQQSKADLDISKAGANGKIGAFPRPMHGADAVPGPQIAELGDLAVGGGPEVDASP